MRRQFFKELYLLMKNDPDIYAIAIDLGYGGFNDIMNDFPNRFINTGASEQCALAIACGLVQSGKKVFVYSITPFLLWRGAEIIRDYINHEQYNVCLVGSGRDNDYQHDGFTHYAGDDATLLDPFTKIKSKWPTSESEMSKYVREYLVSYRPYYINLKR